jgi:hypothetical protein
MFSSKPIAIKNNGKYTDKCYYQCYTPDYCSCSSNCECRPWHIAYWKTMGNYKASPDQKKPLSEVISDAIRKRTAKRLLRSQTEKAQLHSQRRAAAKPVYVDYENYCDGLSSIFISPVVPQPVPVAPLGSSTSPCGSSPVN